MRLKSKTVTANVRLMRSPVPSHVSLVNHGANQQGFSVIKHNDLPARRKSKKATEKNMAKTKKTGNRATRRKAKSVNKRKKAPVSVEDATVQRLTFSKKHFPKKKDVQKFLDDNEYDEDTYTITSKSTEYVVKSTLEEAINATDVRKNASAMEDGIVAYIGKAGEAPEEDDEAEDVSKDDGEDEDADDEAEGDEDDADEDEDDEDDEDGDDADDEDDEDADDEDEEDDAEEDEEEDEEDEDDDEDAVKSSWPTLTKYLDDETVLKVDWWDTYYSNGKSISDAIEDGTRWDSAPLGYEIVLAGLQSATKNVLEDEDLDMDEKTAAIAAIGVEYADFTTKLYGVMSEIVGDKDVQKAVGKKMVKAAKSVVEGFEDSPVSQTFAKQKGDYKKKPKKPKAKAKTKAKASDDEPDILGAVADAIGKAIAPLAKDVADLKKNAAANTRKMSKRISDMENRAPSRKSVGIEDDDDASELEDDAAEEQASKEAAANLRKSMGVSPRRK